MFMYNVILHIGEGLHDFVIQTVRQNPTEVAICQVIGPPLKTKETRRIRCRRGAVGSIVRITQQPFVKEVLTLCEVEIYGTFGKTAIYG